MAHENNKICRVFKALSEPKRYRIVTMLANGKMSASEILKHFNVTQPTLSHDMRLLIDAELVNNQRIGKSVMYELNPTDAKHDCCFDGYPASRGRFRG